MQRRPLTRAHQVAVLALGLTLIGPALGARDRFRQTVQQEKEETEPWWEGIQNTEDLLKTIAAWDDDELRTNFESCTDHWDPWEEWNAHDACLIEMVRRGGTAWGGYLFEVLERRRSHADAECVQFGTGHLEVLTALRRLEGKADPMKVRIENEGPLDTVFPEMPVFRVRLQNVDENKESLHITNGGNYRSGRLMRWRMELHDEHGKSIGIRTRPHIIGGGMYNRMTLGPGEMWGSISGADREDDPKPIRLPLRHYAELPGPGRYTVTIQYHDRQTIADRHDTRSLILSRSDEVEFSWKAREVRLTSGERAALAELLSDLYTEASIALWSMPYHDGMEFEEETTVPAKAIYRYGWKALPILLDALEQDEDLHHRAWLLAMLSNITGLNQSTHPDSPFGRYRMLVGPVVAGGGVMRGVSSGSDGGPTERGQARLIEAWMKYHDLVRVVE